MREKRQIQQDNWYPSILRWTASALVRIHSKSTFQLCTAYSWWFVQNVKFSQCCISGISRRKSLANLVETKSRYVMYNIWDFELALTAPPTKSLGDFGKLRRVKGVYNFSSSIQIYYYFRESSSLNRNVSVRPEE